MKTKVLFTICCLAATTMVMRAQDIITKTNGDEIKAKVTEVDLNEVKYKRFENLSGPTYTMAKSDIFMIKYENGEKDVFKKSSGESSSGVSGQRAAAQTQRAAPSASAYRSTTTSTAQSVSAKQKAPTYSTEAEPESEPRTRWGVKAGLNFAYESGENSDEQTDMRTGFHLGLFLETPISAKIGFQSELIYSMQGGQFKSGPMEKLDYINLPLIFKFYLGEQQRWSIDAGPQIGYMISAKDNSYDFYDSSDLKKFEVSICVGVSYKIMDNLDATFRVNVGMTKIYEDYTNKNNVGQLGVGYRF